MILIIIYDSSDQYGGNPKHDYEQSQPNSAQYLVRRKSNKNLQPRQFQQNRSSDRYSSSNILHQPAYSYSKPNICYNDGPRLEVEYKDIDQFASGNSNDAILQSKNRQGELIQILLLDHSRKILSKLLSNY